MAINLFSLVFVLFSGLKQGILFNERYFGQKEIARAQQRFTLSCIISVIGLLSFTWAIHYLAATVPHTAL